jgi:hypothetical protein
MIASQLVTTRLPQAVFRNLQKRNAYTRRANIISAPARNKISKQVHIVAPIDLLSLYVKFLGTL